jgi:hypothetical protein
METYSYTKEGIEDLLEVAKTVLLKDLMHRGLIDAAVAERYAGQTIMTISKKSFFRTITNLWRKEPETSGFYIIATHSDNIDVLPTTKEKEPSDKVVDLSKSKNEYKH